MVSSFAQSCPTINEPMACSTPGSSVLHCLPELDQINVHCVGDAIEPSHPLPLLLPPSIFSSTRVFSSESAILIRWPKNRSFSISPSSEYSEYSVFISFGIGRAVLRRLTASLIQG